jgi:uncharacterized protein YkwD
MTAYCYSRALFVGALLLIGTVTGKADTAKAETTPAPPSATSGPDFRGEVEKRTFELVNDYRKTRNLAPLAWSEAIARLAREHSKDMATGDVDFGHGGFGDRAQALKAQMTGFRGMGENVLYTSNLVDVAKNAVTMWLHSPHHLANIRGDYNYSGLGVWQDKDGTIYFTQIFVKAEGTN